MQSEVNLKCIFYDIQSPVSSSKSKITSTDIPSPFFLADLFLWKSLIEKWPFSTI